MPIQFLPKDANIRSTNSGVQTSFSVVNETSGLMSVYWINQSGTYIGYDHIAPGGSNTYSTITSHPWLVRTPGQEIKFFPTQSGVITVNDVGPSFSLGSDEQFIGKWSSVWGHGIPDVAKALDVDDAFTPLVETALNNHGILNLLNVPAAWANGFRGDGVKVAVLDTGIYTHSELTVSQQYSVVTKTNNSGATESNLHGLRVASPIAAKYDENKYSGSPVADITGVAPNVHLIDIGVTMSGGGSNDALIAQGIDYAVQQGAKVIQISQINNTNKISNALMDAVQNAYNQGSLVVWAGGNFKASTPTGPAITSFAGISLSVGNFNYETSQPFASSNIAGMIKSNYVFAPSNGYYPNAQGGYDKVVDGGTSYASPYVSGIAALLFQKYPNASVDEIIAMIIGSTWIPSAGRSAEFNPNGNRVLGLDDLKSTAIKTSATDVVKINAVVGQSTISKEADKLYLNYNGQRHDVTGADRIMFDDKAFAFDAEDAAGDALEIMFALTQRAFFESPEIVGLLLHKLDTQDRNEVVEFAALNVLGPNWDIRQLITVASKNIYGIDSASMIDFMLALPETSGVSDMDLFWSIAESEKSHSEIGLVGIISDGVAFIPTYA